MSLAPVIAGTAVTAQVTFAVGGVATDPTTVTFKYRAGGATEVVWEYGVSGSVTKVSVGVYQAVVDTTNLPGAWRVEWWGTGVCAVVTTADFQVNAPPL